MSDNQMKPQRALRPDAQAFDEVRIVTVPRYKTSGLSGDEWRISARIDFMRKGRVVHSEVAGKVQAATAMLPGLYLRAMDDGLGYYAGMDDLCDQEGCAEKGTVTVLLLKEFSRDDPHTWNRKDERRFRLFCDRHAKRGDCGMDDADRNYRVLSGGTVRQVRDEDVSRSSVVVVGPEGKCDA